MKNNNIMFMIRTITVTLLLVCCCCLVFSFSTNAASKSNKAKRAYNKYLQGIYSKKGFKELKHLPIKDHVFFSVVEMSGDRIPELIVCQGCTAPNKYYIYTYKSGKVKKMKSLDYYVGGEPYYLYPSKHIIVTQEGDSWDAHWNYYKVTNSKLKKVSNCDLSGAKKYSLTKGKFKLKKNNQKNRNKYLR